MAIRRLRLFPSPNRGTLYVGDKIQRSNRNFLINAGFNHRCSTMVLPGVTENSRRGNPRRPVGGIFSVHPGGEYLAPVGRNIELAVWNSLNYVFVSGNSIYVGPDSLRHRDAIY